MSPATIRAFPITEFPIVNPNEDLGKLIAEALCLSEIEIKDDDIFVIASKIVSVSENRIVKEQNVDPSAEAIRIASRSNFDPIHVELALQESNEVIHTNGVLITETHSGSTPHDTTMSFILVSKLIMWSHGANKVLSFCCNL